MDGDVLGLLMIQGLTYWLFYHNNEVRRLFGSDELLKFMKQWH